MVLALAVYGVGCCCRKLRWPRVMALTSPVIRSAYLNETRKSDETLNHQSMRLHIVNEIVSHSYSTWLSISNYSRTSSEIALVYCPVTSELNPRRPIASSFTYMSIYVRGISTIISVKIKSSTYFHLCPPNTKARDHDSVSTTLASRQVLPHSIGEPKQNTSRQHYLKPFLHGLSRERGKKERGGPIPRVEQTGGLTNVSKKKALRPIAC